MVFGRMGTFVIGAGCGAYVAQNYSIPNVGATVSGALERAKLLEQELKKSPNAQTNNNGMGAGSTTGLVAAQLSPVKIR